MLTRPKHALQSALREFAVAVISLGGIGRQVALQLAAPGVERLQLVDCAKLRPAQGMAAGYFAEDVGRPRFRSALADSNDAASQGGDE